MISIKMLPRCAVRAALLFLMVSGVLSAPCRLPAQDASASGDSRMSRSAAERVESKVEASSQEIPKAEKKSEAEETNAYRHSATVQWFARLLHVDVETAAKLFEFINFAVILLAIGIPLFRILPRTFRERSARLSAELETARAATADAKTRLSAVEAKLAGLDAEIAAIRNQVEQEMVQDEARFKSSAVEESARIVAAAEREIAMAAAQAQRGLKRYAAELAIDGALTRLVLNEETDRALIAEFTQLSTSGKAGRN